MDLIEGSKGIDINYWYYRRKFNLISNFLNKLEDIISVCDVGAGQALFSIELSRRYPNTNFVATDIHYGNDWIDRRDFSNLRFQRDYFPSHIVLLNDVIEHVPNPVLFLSEIVDISDRGTTFLITVPAFEHLWSGHDDYLQHFRRYNMKTLRQDIEAAGLREVEMNYIYWTIYPLVLLYRKLNSRSSRSNLEPRPILDKFLRWLMTFEEKFRKSKIPGVSIWCVAIKP